MVKNCQKKSKNLEEKKMENFLANNNSIFWYETIDITFVSVTLNAFW